MEIFLIADVRVLNLPQVESALETVARYIRLPWLRVVHAENNALLWEAHRKVRRLAEGPHWWTRGEGPGAVLEVFSDLCGSLRPGATSAADGRALWELSQPALLPTGSFAARSDASYSEAATAIGLLECTLLDAAVPSWSSIAGDLSMKLHWALESTRDTGGFGCFDAGELMGLLDDLCAACRGPLPYAARLLSMQARDIWDGFYGSRR